jgi:protein JSN1
MSRDRAATLTSIKSVEDPASPGQSSFSKEGMIDSGVRTLDYLGLAETPHHANISQFRPISASHMQQDQLSGMSELLANLDLRNANRFRSFSVNAPQKYVDDAEDDFGTSYPSFPNGTMTPSAAAALEAYEAVQEKVRLHNQAVQAFAENASAARPRARTAGVVETPPRTSIRSLLKAPSPIGSGIPVNGQNAISTNDGNLTDALQLMNMSGDFHASRFEAQIEDDGQASRSLWIGSIPVSTTASSLDAIFGRFGSLESTRVLTHKNCGFVNFDHVESAARARQLLNGKEIFPGSGPVRIGFAKAPTGSASITPGQNTLPPSPTRDAFDAEQPQNQSKTTLTSNQVHPTSNGDKNEHAVLMSQAARLAELQPEILQIVLDFGAHDSDLAVVSSSIENAIAHHHFEREIPPIPETGYTRMYDAPKLRDIRKRIDSGACGLQEIEQIANDMLPEIAELSSDYLGNTVVQKLFEYCSEQTKEQMLTFIAPHLAEIGVHKNGTWAAQKIIEVCKTETQTRLIVESLRSYTVPLFLDQYGNYVLQCCLRFGSPYNDFIFESMLSQMWEIAQGRFGARAMRACLESHHSSKDQQYMLAAAIALHSVQLATNANGALLLTWFLDTCNFPRRRAVLAPRLIPHLIHLCTHKVAYLTVLKVINQRNEPEARDMVLKALFFSHGDNTLEQILSDQTSGATLVFKILTTPFFDDQLRTEVVRNIAQVLTRIKAQPSQGYKRLMDEVGLSSRPTHTALQNTHSHAHPSAVNQSRPMSQPNTMNFMPPQIPQRQYSGNYVPNIGFTSFENGQSPVRTGSADSFGFPSYALNSYNAQSSFSPMQQVTPQHLQYPNYAPVAPRANGNYISDVGANAFAGYATPPPSVDMLRGMQAHGSPLHATTQMSPIISHGGFGQQTYTQTLPGNMYGYQQQNFYPQQMQTVLGPGRNRRVSHFARSV